MSRLVVILAKEACDGKIEAGIVNEYHHVGLPLDYVFAANLHAAEYLRQVEQHGNEAHVGQLLVVPHAGAAHGKHLVASEEAELGFGVALLELLHKSRSVEVATGFACNKIVFHRLSQSFMVSRKE